jgi:sulfoxide reductase heme-binding subunit YedZ
MSRPATHATLAGLTVAVCLLSLLYPRASTPVQAWTIGLGYLSLALIGATLLIGPLGLRVRRRNPVNVYVRRDVGIWAGITGVVHVLLGSQAHFNGEILRYFFFVRENEAIPLTDLFGLSNWFGLAATVVLLGLLALSNDLSLRMLRGPLWKWLQRFNYALIALVLIHTVGYQLVVGREAPFAGVTLVVTIAVLAAQLAGVVIMLLRRVNSRTHPPADQPASLQ